MIKLKVENFSCIKSAELDLSTFNVLIGPQASGKSVLSKLLYFFIDSFQRQYERISQSKTFDNYTDDIKHRFSEWFPPSAWGEKKFRITFQAGEYRVHITRVSYAETIKRTLRLHTSTLVKEHYADTTELFRTARSKATKRTNTPWDNIELSYRIQVAAQKELKSKLQRDYIEEQTFIPAGRSFFTNLGRAFLAFDHGRGLDPLTVKFGRLYSNYIQQTRMIYSGTHSNSPYQELEAELAEIMGGTIEWDDGEATISCSGGRKVPLAAMSSGQQEIFPLLAAFFMSQTWGPSKERPSSLLYIEEPEAHLFPASQSRLIKSLVAYANGVSNRRLLLTTHSPYVLATINNLVKAGQLDQKSNIDSNALGKIILKKNRIRPNNISAYAIQEGVLQSILDDDGLIAADYLDDISSVISSEFGKLLDLEFPND